MCPIRTFVLDFVDANHIKEAKEDLLIIGHLPHLGKPEVTDGYLHRGWNARGRVIGKISHI